MNQQKLSQMHKKLIFDAIEINGVPCEGKTELFDTDENQDKETLRIQEKIALELCETCPLKTQCGEYALAAREPYGIWGGMTPRKRQAILEWNATRKH